MSHKRIYNKYEDMRDDTQFGFIKKLGTREPLLSVKLLVQKYYGQRHVFICFIDYQKTFDNITKNINIAIRSAIHINDVKLFKSWKMTLSVQNSDAQTYREQRLVGRIIGRILQTIHINTIFFILK